jgi:hypothetical protein
MRKIETNVDIKTTDGIVNSALEALLSGLDNKGVYQYACDKICSNTHGYSESIGKLRAKFEILEDRTLPSLFGVFDTFEYKGRTLSPQKVVHELLDESQKLYFMLRERAITSLLSNISENQLRSGYAEEWESQFKSYLGNTIGLAEDAAFWVRSLSLRNDIAGKHVRKVLGKYGIDKPENLPSDVKKLGDKITLLYNRLANQYTENLHKHKSESHKGYT